MLRGRMSGLLNVTRARQTSLLPFPTPQCLSEASSLTCRPMSMMMAEAVAIATEL